LGRKHIDDDYTQNCIMHMEYGVPMGAWNDFNLLGAAIRSIGSDQAEGHTIHLNLGFFLLQD